MDTPATFDPLLRYAAIALTATSIFVATPLAMAQTQPASFKVADDAYALNPDESSQASDDSQPNSNSSAEGSQPSSKKKSPPADVHGGWCGPMTDNFFGAGSMSIDLGQKGSKLTGTWNTSLVGGGSLKGKMIGSSLTLTLRQQGSHCKALVHGTLVQPGEVTGSYTIFGCQQTDGGTFDITSPDC